MGNEETHQEFSPGVNWTLENVTDYVESCFDRDTILDVLLGYSEHWFPSRMILIVGRAWVQLFSTAEFDLADNLPREARRSDIDDDAPAVNEDVATGTADELGLGALFEGLGLGSPLIRTIGLRIGSRVAIVLAGTVHDEQVNTEALQAAAMTASRQLEDVIRMAKNDTLPPAADRVPAFPDISHPASQSGPPGQPAIDGRRTQNLQSGFEGEPALSTPRLTLTVPAESDAEQKSETSESEEINSNATSFGLPFIESGGLKIPGVKAEADEPSSPESESSGPSEPSNVSSASEAEEHPETMIGSPFLDEAFPGELDDPFGMEEESSDAIDLGNGESGVKVVPPNSISEHSPNRTQLGGLSVSAASFAGPGQAASSVAEDDELGTIIGQPNIAGNPGATRIGGVSGEQKLVSESLARAESDAVEAAASEALRSEADAEAPPKPELEPTKTPAAGQQPQAAGWMRSRTKSGVPTAMILKPARKRKREQAGTAEPEMKSEVASPEQSKEAPVLDANPAKPAKPAKPLKPAKPPKPTRSEKAEPSSSRPFEEPTRVAPNPAGAAADQTEDAKWDREKQTRKFDTEGDDWFDYFADQAENEGNQAEPETALNFSLSEPSDDPHTIPPETLERLLDSGPEMVDMQEQFIVLDSRDRDKAFEAADRVAELGEKAAEVLTLMFPGRVFLDRYQFADDLPPVDQHGPVLHALVRLGDLSLSVAEAHLDESSNEARFYAVFLLTKLDAAPLLPKLFDRLFDRDQQIRRVAAELVLQYQTADVFDASIRQKLRKELTAGDDVHITVAATLMAKLRDRNGIEALIDAMDDSATPRVKLAVLNALTEITLHQWSSPYEWRQWWKNAKKQTRSEWVVDALDAADGELRRRAYEEVQLIPGLELNYHPEQPSKLRKRAQKELTAWFEKTRA